MPVPVQPADQVDRLQAVGLVSGDLEKPLGLDERVWLQYG